MNLTDRQREMLHAIHRLTTKVGYPPSIRELGERLGISSTNGVIEHIKALDKKGMVDRNRYHSRSLRLTLEGEEALGLNEGPDDLEKAAKQALAALEGVLEKRHFALSKARMAADALRLAGVR